MATILYQKSKVTFNNGTSKKTKTRSVNNTTQRVIVDKNKNVNKYSGGDSFSIERKNTRSSSQDSQEEIRQEYIKQIPTSNGRLAAYSGNVSMFPGSKSEREEYLNNPKGYKFRKYLESVDSRTQDIKDSGFTTTELFKGKVTHGPDRSDDRSSYLDRNNGFLSVLPTGEIQTTKGTTISYFENEAKVNHPWSVYYQTRIKDPAVAEALYLREQRIATIDLRRKEFFTGKSWQRVEDLSYSSAYKAFGPDGPGPETSPKTFQVYKGIYTMIYGGGLLAGAGSVMMGENLAAIGEASLKQKTILMSTGSVINPVLIGKASRSWVGEITNPMPGARAAREEFAINAPIKTVQAFDPRSVEGSVNLLTAGATAFVIRPQVMANPLTRKVMTSAYPDTYKYADQVNIKFFEAHTDPTDLNAVRQLEGRTVKTVHVTPSDPFKGSDSFVTVAMPEGSGGFRQKNELYNFYKSSPVPESVVKVNVGGYKTRAKATNNFDVGTGLVGDNQGFKFTNGKSVGAYSYDKSTGRAYLGYAGIGSGESSGKVIVGTPQVKLLVGRDKVSPTPPKIANSDIQTINTYQVARGGETFVPAENLVGASVEGQLISPSNYQGVANLNNPSLKNGLGTLVERDGKSTFLYYATKAKFLGFDTKKWYKFEMIPVKYKQVAGQAQVAKITTDLKSGFTKELDVAQYNRSYGKVRYINPRYGSQSSVLRLSSNSLSYGKGYKSLGRVNSSKSKNKSVVDSSNPYQSFIKSSTSRPSGSKTSRNRSITASSNPSISRALSSIPRRPYNSSPPRTPRNNPPNNQKFYFKLPKLQSKASVKNPGAYRVTSYAPSFSALYFKRLGRPKRGKLSSSGLDYRPVTPGLDITNTRYARRYRGVA